MVSKSSQTAINVAQKLENTVQLVFMRWLLRQEDRGNPNCARADDLTGNSRASGCGNDPHQIHRSGPVEKSFM